MKIDDIVSKHNVDSSETRRVLFLLGSDFADYYYDWVEDNE